MKEQGKSQNGNALYFGRGRSPGPGQAQLRHGAATVGFATSVWGNLGRPAAASSNCNLLILIKSTKKAQPHI